MSQKPRRVPWGKEFDAEVKASAAERRKRKALAMAEAAARVKATRRRAEAKQREEARLVALLVAEGRHTVRMRTYVDSKTAPTLYALALLARHFPGRSVVFRGVKFPVRRSPNGFAILPPGTRDLRAEGGELATWLQ